MFFREINVILKQLLYSCIFSLNYETNLLNGYFWG